MQLDRDSSVFVWTAVCAMVLSLFIGATSVKAATPDELAKQIEKTLSGVQRRIVTAPSRAEKELLQARDLLKQLKEAAPNHGKIAALTKRAANLTTKLEKRLGRPVGGSAKKEETKPAAAAKPAVPSDLPSSVVSRLKRLEDALNAALTALEKDRLQTAATKLAQAKKLMDEIQSRYAKRIPAGNEQMKTATKRLATIGAQYAQAQSAADAVAAAAAEAKQKQRAQSKEWIAKFSPFFSSDTGQYLHIGAAFNRLSEAEQEQCRQAFAKAGELMALYQKTEFPHGRTGELTWLQQRVAGALAIHNEGAARARQEEACRPWVEKLRPYIEAGTASRKRLIAGVTIDKIQIQEQSAFLAEAQALWPEYEKAEFPHGKSPQLLHLEEKMQQRLQEMPEILRQSRALLAGDIEEEFDRILGHLTRNTGWQTDMTKNPNIAMERDIIPLQEAMKRYADTVEPDDAKLTILKQKLAQIKEQDQKNRAVRAERTYMTPDHFAGDGADALRQKVEEIVKDKSASGKTLRITLPAEDWQEESVIEWTDTSHTQLRHRVTRSMTAQAAAKGADGKVYLHGVHLANDRQSDGSWGPLKGHIMWSDWMAEANVDKAPPTP